jgi:hypothetical protein
MMKKVQIRLFNHQILLILAALLGFWLVPFASAIAAPVLQAQDLAVISNPASNAVVQGTVQITGSSDHPSFQFYSIEYSPEPVTGDQWQIIGATHNSPVINGVLENWDTTLVPDGSYTLRLRTVRLDGNYTEAFSQQVVVANAQPLPTDTPLPTEEVVAPAVPSDPTETPTPLPPTPTVSIEQPIVETPTPRPVETSAPLENPDEVTSFIPTVTGFSVSPLRDACLYGAGIMFGVFLLFGFLAALRMFIMGFIHRMRRRT